MVSMFMYAALLWFGAHGCFVVYAGYRRADKEGTQTLYWKVMLYPFLIIGIALDIVFSLTFGWVMFFDIPRLELFTTKLKRMKTRNTWRRELATFFCRNYNIYDPHHC